MDRKEVYSRVDGERDYQNCFVGDQGNSGMSVGEELLLIEEYVKRAREEWANDFDQPEVTALHMVRKIAGICVRCMETHGAPKREV